MSIAPQKFREIVFLLLYSHDFGSEDDVFDMVMSELAVTRRTVREADLIKDKIL